MTEADNNPMSERNIDNRETKNCIDDDYMLLEKEEASLEQAAINGYGGLQAAIRIISSVASSNYDSLASLSSSVEPIIKTLREIKAITTQIDFNALGKTISYIQQGISEIAKCLESPFYSEEKRRELLDAYRMWGEFGWTINLNEKIKNLINKKPPLDKKEADKIALQECKNTEDLFQTLYSQKRVKKKDLEEAICDFRERRYKSCALILFSLIDAILIRFQRNKETQGRRRSVGLSAVRKAKERLGIDEETQLLFAALFYVNVFACLGKFFENGNDFKKQPDVINRNFLDHGMLTRPVRRKDCLQLFLLYSNMLRMLDMEYRVL